MAPVGRTSKARLVPAPRMVAWQVLKERHESAEIHQRTAFSVEFSAPKPRDKPDSLPAVSTQSLPLAQTWGTGSERSLPGAVEGSGLAKWAVYTHLEKNCEGIRLFKIISLPTLQIANEIIAVRRRRGRLEMSAPKADVSIIHA